MFFLIFNLLFVFAEEKSSADLFDLVRKNKLFTYESTRKMEQDKMLFEAQFKDAATGEVVVSEKAEILKGVIVRYEVQRLPTKETGVIETKDGKIIFTYTENGKKSESREPLKENTLVSATLAPYLESKMEDLLAKKDVDFRYAVWFRKETVGFRFSYDKEQNGQVVIKMNPTNFLYKSLVKPIYFTYQKATKKLISVEGRTTPKQKVGSAWKDLDALSVYK